MSPETVHAALLCAAFWTAVAGYRGERPTRFVAALFVGAALAHLGWAALHWQAVREHPLALLDPGGGYCALFGPLALLALAREPAAWRALPRALAVARLGCLAAGCTGTAAALLEGAACLALHATLHRVPGSLAAPAFAAGFGLARLASEPLREAPVRGEPAVSPALLAALWVALGAAWALARRLRSVAPAGSAPGSLRPLRSRRR